MGTKWKSRVVWTVMFTFGISGILSFLTLGSSYVHKDYFQTPEFQSELQQFANNLNRFELNSITLEQAKRSITVAEYEINNYRNQFGDETYQIDNVNAEFESLILEALAMDDQAAADIYTAERDQKIEGIKKMFANDDDAKAQIIARKEQILREYYQEQEYYRPDYLIYKETFQYLFKNKVTGKSYTNLQNSGGQFDNDLLFITSYSIPKEYSMNGSIPAISDELANSFIPFEGQIVVPKFLPSSNPVMIEYERYKQKQIIWLVYILTSIGTLILCLYLKKARGIPAENEAWRLYYNKFSIDARVMLFTLTAIGAIIFPLLMNEQIFYDIENLFVYSSNVISYLAIASICWGFSLIQGKFLIASFKDQENVRNEWDKALLKRAGRQIKSMLGRVGRGLRSFSSKVKCSLRDAFLNKSLGMQLFFILVAVFGLGIAVIMIVIDPVFIIIYLILLALIGLPLVMILIKSIGYFNLILIKTNEVAVGNLGQDLAVSGKSVLANLASNINMLKHGVKTSQNEQAKSERLKTELITNVSHDLRTPLTSIITYTDLLKMEGITNEDRAAYLEIIDRKSKRLKVLIDDLFEVSKMASGNLELKMEKVDLVQLLQQTLAEHDNTINDSSLQFRITYAEMPVFAFVDGNKLWRVFDNLIENVLKYSLDNSRVYIMVGTNNHQATVTFKNVSKFELSENIDELFERFKRGDTSRQTEGSGLGLAIAKSIVDLHEGSLNIETEGDLFKVSISLKLVV
ncbi:sensor histidine kinase [Paenibacillus endoradicis]|uniref:sensor histidine kinase n=1 Tax=Paenibacillus endoradicis TaxID=2972487 RepID=UPI002159A2C3|nr:HAMP domain-containing sensor histidine kinase [Paenibacillus endoradicis]MCR8657528.1 HAMP domain-containing histidine kinase [Paenibacillus endoradicis]